MKRGAVIGVIAGAIAVLAIGGGIAWWLIARNDGADAAAERYLAALEEGDSEAIAALLPPEISDDDRRMIDAAFAGATGHIADARIVEHADDGSFRAEATVGDEAADILFAFREREGAWLLDGDFLAAIDVTTTLGTHVTVGDAQVPVGTVRVLPAVYTVSAAPSSILAGSVTVPVSNDAVAVAAIDAVLAPEADATVQAALAEHVAACTTPAPQVPAGCGIRVPWGADLATLSGLAYRVEQEPVVALAADASSFAATGGDLVITATGTTRAGAPASFTYRDAAWTLRGTIGFDDDGIVLSVR